MNKCSWEKEPRQQQTGWNRDSLCKGISYGQGSTFAIYCSLWTSTTVIPWYHPRSWKASTQKKKERRNKKDPQDKKALHGPPDKSTNFASTTTPKTSKRKQPPPAQNEVQPKPKKTAEHLSVVTRPALMFQSVKFCMRMMCGMMAQLPELSSVTRRNSGCKRFHFPMVKQH